MNTTDLGPLERAILRALVATEAAGAPALNADSLWRVLPGYATHPTNVRAALADGAPLRRYVAQDGGRFALHDRPDAFTQADAASERARALWSEVAPVLRGLAKLPWIEAVAVAGSWSFGYSPSPDAPIEVALLAEGGRADAARAAFTASLRSRGPVAQRIRLADTWDADQPPPFSTDSARLRFCMLRPVTNPEGWAWLRAQIPDLDDAFPNAPWDATAPDFLLADRLDGRLAQLRRNLLGGTRAVLTADTRAGNRRLLLDRALGGVVQRLAGDVPVHRVDLSDTADRWADVQSWEFEVARPKESTPDEEVIPDAPAEEPQVEGSAVEAPAEVPPSRRKRGAQKRPVRTATSGSSSTGRRANRRQ